MHKCDNVINTRSIALDVTVTFGRLGDRDYWPSCGMVTV